MRRGAWWALFATLIVCGAAHAGPEDKLLDPANLDRVAQRLGLDDAALAKLKERAYAGQKVLIPVRAELTLARSELRRLLDGDPPERAAVLKQVDTTGALETRYRRARMEVMLDMRALLTPEQRRALRGMRGELRDRKRRGRRARRSRNGKGPPPPPPPRPEPPRRPGR
jgi:periplasmic protein CpxP/Spy